LSERYFDIVRDLTEPKKEEPENTEKIADKIIAETIAKCGLKLMRT
jgi:hypothetical protein